MVNNQDIFDNKEKIKLENYNKYIFINLPFRCY